MVYHAHIENGTVIFDSPENPPEGAKLEVHVVSPPPTDVSKQEPPWFKYFGAIKDLPADASQRIDEVLYGHPKR
jgi:hypothetical protein